MMTRRIFRHGSHARTQGGGWRVLARLIMNPLILATLLGGVGKAAVIAGQVERLRALSFQEITLLGGTPLNPGPEVTLPVAGTGFIVWDFQDENEAAAEIPFTVRESQFTAVNPLGSLLLTSTSADGLISDLMKSDDSGLRSSFLSGALEVPRFIMGEVTSGPGAGLMIFSRDPAVFRGTVTGLPFPEGTTFASPDPLDFFTEIGGSELRVAVSFNRAVTIVPEPNLVVLSGLGLIGVLGRRREGAAYRSLRESRS